MTKNELMTAIVNGTEITEEMKETAQHILDVDAAAKERQKQKRASDERPESAAHKENREVYLPQMLEVMGDEPKTAAELAEMMGIKTPKATAVAKIGIELGQISVDETKVPKKGVVKVYSKV